MKLNIDQFLDLDSVYANLENSAVVMLPIPYEGGISYGAGARFGPAAIIEVSKHLELYDEILDTEPYRVGISTLEPLDVDSCKDPKDAFESIYDAIKSLITENKFVVAIGGDHSISTASVKAHSEFYSPFGVIQIDAHSDLRDSYEGNKFSHACVMARVREFTTHTLQIGIRSMSIDEARLIKELKLPVCKMTDYRRSSFSMDRALNTLPEHIYVTLDVDAFDWSVIRSTGTPEPGGFQWDEMMDLLEKIFSTKTVVGFDVVELSHDQLDKASPFAAAKLIYKMIGFKLNRYMRDTKCPQMPAGPIFGYTPV
jgi:agmatinase